MQNLVIDIAHRGVIPPVIVTQGDAMSRFFKVTLLNDGVAYTLPESPLYSVRYECGANTGWYDTITEPDESTHPAVTVSGNEFTVEIAEPVTYANGILGLMINGGGGYQLTITGIKILTDDIPGYDAGEVANYYNVFVNQMHTATMRAEAAAAIAIEYGATIDVDSEQLIINHHDGDEAAINGIFAPSIVTNASGGVAAVSDGADNVPVGSLVSQITPVQSGSGTPSPSNIRAITGRTGLTLTRAGKNLFSPTQDSFTHGDVTFTRNADGSYTANGTASGNIADVVGTFLFKAGVTYIFSGSPLPFQNGVFVRANGPGAGEYTYNYIDMGSGVQITMAEDTILHIGTRIASGTVANNLVFRPMIRHADIVDDTFAPYSGTDIAISWQTEAGTIYGGSLDVTTGVLTVDKTSTTISELSWTYEGSYTRFRTTINDMKQGYATRKVPLLSSAFQTIDDGRLVANVPDNSIYGGGGSSNNIFIKDTAHSTSDAFTTAYGTQTIVYPLATPTAYQLTPTEVRTLLGNNTIYTDAGEVSVEYVADTKRYIDGKIAELQALVLEN